MEKYADFVNIKPLANNHLSPYFNFTSGLQPVTDAPDIATDQIPKHLELIKCSVCNRTIDMYIDIDKAVFKRFYCLTCISSKKIPTTSQFSSKSEYNGINGNTGMSRQEPSSSNQGTNSSQTKSQSSQSTFSSPSFSPVNLQVSTKKARLKQSHKQCPNYGTMVIPCDNCNPCPPYNHFLDVVPCHSIHHSCDKDKGLNKRSWSVANRRPWSTEQKDTIFSYFGQQIESRATIGKDDILPLMELKKDLFADRSWKEIKWVYYHHLKVLENRKVRMISGSSGSEGDGLTDARLALVSQ